MVSLSYITFENFSSALDLKSGTFKYRRLFNVAIILATGISTNVSSEVPRLMIVLDLNNFSLCVRVTFHIPVSYYLIAQNHLSLRAIKRTNEEPSS